MTALDISRTAPSPPSSEQRQKREAMYSTSTATAYHFTVITPQCVYRVKARTEQQIRSACTAVGITVLGVERDSE